MSEAAFTGSRTFTPTRSPADAPPLYTVSVTRTCRVLPPPAGNDSVRHPGSDTEPRVVTHRYSTRAGSRSTVNVAVKAGARPPGGGQAPEYSARSPATATPTDCFGRPPADAAGAVAEGAVSLSATDTAGRPVVSVDSLALRAVSPEQ
ncbi:hypothetical protein ABZ760_33215, partial [Streptomyces sp. NPDC006658]|uniref:hypothetical protein n=1 Tax=Streptomyces sp. NPDC006658 TaxID=3156900 RepID=UPI00340AD423